MGEVGVSLPPAPPLQRRRRRIAGRRRRCWYTLAPAQLSIIPFGFSIHVVLDTVFIMQWKLVLKSVLDSNRHSLQALSLSSRLVT